MVDKFDYDAARLIAADLISEFGEFGSFVRKGNTGGYDDDGNVITDSPDLTIEGTITPKLEYSSGEIDGEVIKKGDAMVYFHSADEVKVGDITTINGLEYRAINIRGITSVSGVVVYREIQIRR